MPNYILSRTSPPEHVYERKINLGYGIKVDTSDAPKPKGKNMKDVKTLDVAKEPVNAAFADGTEATFTQIDSDYPGDEENPEITSLDGAIPGREFFRESFKAEEAEG